MYLYLILSNLMYVSYLLTEIAESVNPRHRFMSAYEQRVEPPDRKWQYLLFAAEPYETIAFKVICLNVAHTKVNEEHLLSGLCPGNIS